MAGSTFRSWPGDPRRRLGRRGEKAAVRHLRRCGYRILHRNLDLGCGELDIVARDGEILVFVEVKTRRGNRPPPILSVDADKRQRLARLARRYLARHRRGALPRTRFDVVEAMARPWRPVRVRLHRDAFRA